MHQHQPVAGQYASPRLESPAVFRLLRRRCWRDAGFSRDFRRWVPPLLQGPAPAAGFLDGLLPRFLVRV